MSAIAHATPPEADIAPLRVAVCGEVCSGKSTLINALMRQSVLPDLFGSPNRPVIRVSSDAPKGWTGLLNSGHAVSIPVGSEKLPEDLAELVICPDRDIPALQGVEIVEFPPFAHDDVSEAQIAQLDGFDLLIWTTIGSQAWRLSERNILDHLAQTRPNRAFLAITRADKFRRKTDQTKVFKRVQRDADPYFLEFGLIGASSSNIATAASDETVWQDMGAAYLAEWIQAHAALPERASPDHRTAQIFEMADYVEASAPLPPLPDLQAMDGEAGDVLFGVLHKDAPEHLATALDTGANGAAIAKAVGMASAPLVNSPAYDGLEQIDIQFSGHHAMLGRLNEEGQFAVGVFSSQEVNLGMARTRFARFLAGLTA